MIKVLLVEDSAADIELVRKSIQGEPISLSVVSVKAELESLLTQQFNVCLVDMVLPSFSGKEAIELVRRYQPQLPVVVYTGSLSQEQMVEIVRSGMVVDVIDKAAWQRLPQAIKRVHKEKQASLELEEAERVNKYGRVIMGVVHDWANCTQPVFLFLEYVKKFLSGQQELRMLEMTIKSLNRGTTLQRQLVTALRGIESRFKTVVLNTLLEDVVGFLHSCVLRDTKVKVNLADLPDIQGDEISLFQAIINLILNARDALQGQGTITITSQCLDLQEKKIAGQGDQVSGKWVVISVGDDGPGMSPETAAQCWDVFFTTKPIGQGTGLGLSNSRSAILRHGGKIGLETAPGKGAVFTVYLPVNP